jgi:hypothetical protein
MSKKLYRLHMAYRKHAYKEIYARRVTGTHISIGQCACGKVGRSYDGKSYEENDAYEGVCKPSWADLIDPVQDYSSVFRAPVVVAAVKKYLRLREKCYNV